MIFTYILHSYNEVFLAYLSPSCFYCSGGRVTTKNPDGQMLFKNVFPISIFSSVNASSLIC